MCNPFFLCSAALLLFGINRLYNDPEFLGNDEAQKLLFNFGALQIYELLLMGTAILLAHRKVWYDSALLVVLENGLLLLPFMLISQAGLIDDVLGWALTGTGSVMVAGRFAGIKRWYPQFNLPSRALGLGAFLLVINAALPRVFRAVIAVDYYNWHVPNLIAWHVALPLLAAAANLLPRPMRYGGLNPERHWLPIFLYALWITGTGVHIWSVGHIAGRPFEWPLIAPTIWVCAWTFWNRLRDFMLAPSAALQKLMLALAFLAPFVARDDATILTILLALNAAGFIVVYLARHFSAAKHLALVSVLLAFASMPLDWRLPWVMRLSRGEHIVIAAIAFCIMAALRSRRPEAGLFGALAVGLAVTSLIHPWTPALGLQASFVFFLVHSLRWQDDPAGPNRIIRSLAAVLWVINALVLTREGWSAFMAAGAMVTGYAWAFYAWRGRHRDRLVIPISSGATALSGPMNWFIANSSAGLIALAASLVLFATGTAFALTRSRWEEGKQVLSSKDADK